MSVIPIESRHRAMTSPFLTARVSSAGASLGQQIVCPFGISIWNGGMSAGLSTQSQAHLKQSCHPKRSSHSSSVS